LPIQPQSLIATWKIQLLKRLREGCEIGCGILYGGDCLVCVILYRNQKREIGHQSFPIAQTLDVEMGTLPFALG
jgi:hypothetical protein